MIEVDKKSILDYHSADAKLLSIDIPAEYGSYHLPLISTILIDLDLSRLEPIRTISKS